MKFGKINLPIGKEKSNIFNLNNHVIATGEMGQLIPIRQIECVPGDKFDINVSMFTRTAPLVCPTYGSVKFTTRAFFVPTRLVMAHFKEFITGKPVAIDGGYYNPDVPRISNLELSEIFRNSSNGLMVQKGSAPADVELRDTNGAVVGFFNFTAKGRTWLKFLNGLGYRWNFLVKNNNSSEIAIQYNSVDYSLLPLFAFLRVYMDYYLPSQFLVASPVKQFFDGYVTIETSHDLLIERLYTVLDSIQLTYDDDYFTTAWRYPLSLDGSLSGEELSIPQHPSIFGSDDDSLLTESNSYGSLSTNTNSGPSDSFAIQLARSLANFVIRNNFAGSRAIEQILARFGIKVPDYEFQRSVHFGTSVSNLQIMDVTNTAESEDFKLGSFGAKAIGFDNGNKFHFECKEYGYILLLTSIMPETSMGWQGFDRNLMHLSKFDFFTPEFDGKFMTPVLSGELYSDYKGQDDEDYQDLVDNNCQPLKIFGFCPSYSEYKCAKDNVIGDFNVTSLKQGLDAYHLFRDIYPSSNIVAQNPDIIYFDDEQYNRIFNVTDKSADHFYMIYRINVKAFRPMKSISQAIPFDDNDIEHRNTVGMDANGSQFNN